MRAFTLCIISSLLLVGCASFQEAYYTDRELNLAQQAAFDMQVAYPDYRHTGKTPQDLEGILAEEIMDTYIDSYSEGFTRSDIEVTEVGTESGSGGGGGGQ